MSLPAMPVRPDAHVVGTYKNMEMERLRMKERMTACRHLHNHVDIYTIMQTSTRSSDIYTIMQMVKRLEGIIVWCQWRKRD